MAHQEGDIGDKRTYVVRLYQDEIDTDSDKVDPLMNELNDDPVEMFGVPANELRAELDRSDPEVIDLDDPDRSEDMREQAESFVDNAQ